MKKFIHHIYYFFYLAINWNLPLALFVMWHELKRGTKYGINTVKPESLKRLTITEGDVTKSSPYEAVSYYLLESLLKAFRKFSNASSIIDLGCGKGRVMVTSAFYGFTSITGIDFAKELCEEAEKNMKKTETKFKSLKWKVICKDVLNYQIQDDDQVFFMSNPFEKEILTTFLDKIEISLKKYPRTIWFLYSIPVYLETMLQHNYKIIYHIRPERKLSAAILKKEYS